MKILENKLSWIERLLRRSYTFLLLLERCLLSVSAFAAQLVAAMVVSAT